MPDSRAKRKRLQHQFKILRDFLMTHYLNGIAHLEYWRELREQRLNGTQPISQNKGILFSNEFIHYTEQAHWISSFLYLARLVDEHRDAREIRKFLIFVQNHSNIFSNYLDQIGSIRDLRNEVAQDLMQYETFLRLRKQIKLIRDKFLVHFDRQSLTSHIKDFDHLSLDYEQMSQLYDFIGQMLNKYSAYFDDTR